MKFRYARYNGVLRPVIPIKLKHAGAEIGYHVLVDSGAEEFERERKQVLR